MKEAIKVTLDAIPSLLLIIIVIGGIVGGIFYRYRRCWHLCSLLPDPLYLLP